ncbi:MAG: hypothetical protein ACJ761_02440 [Chloroflexota bacterium]
MVDEAPRGAFDLEPAPVRPPGSRRDWRGGRLAIGAWLMVLAVVAGSAVLGRSSISVSPPPPTLPSAPIASAPPVAVLAPAEVLQLDLATLAQDTITTRKIRLTGHLERTTGDLDATLLGPDGRVVVSVSLTRPSVASDRAGASEWFRLDVPVPEPRQVGAAMTIRLVASALDGATIDEWRQAIRIGPLAGPWAGGPPRLIRLQES